MHLPRLNTPSRCTTCVLNIDAPFCEWWNTRFPDHPLLPGQAIPIQKNLQGCPEAPHQWSIHIHGIIVTKLALVPTTHAPCLYSGHVDGASIILLQQVDDFAVACKHIDIYH
jgi:hypothetical protein